MPRDILHLHTFLGNSMTKIIFYGVQICLISLLIQLAPISPKAHAEDLDLPEIKGEEQAVLTDAPEVPAPITRSHATKVIVQLEAKELQQRLADGVKYTYWTFGGKVPGKFIRVRRGDLIEFHLHNHPSSKMPHNIDLHAVTGPGGGAASSFSAPGHSSVFSFRALNPGLFVYHCATAPVGMHIANGMYGLILVEPEEGLSKVDKEFYVMQSEFYTKGRYGQAGLQPFSMEKAISENPDYVVFNGSVGALLGDNALKAKTGDTIRLFVGNGGPNLTSSFHVIGEIFDKVYTEGGSLANQINVQTTLIPAGGSVITEFKTEVPGNLILVDHAIFRAFNKGALAQINVEGAEVKNIYSGKEKDEVYLPEGGNIQNITQSAPLPPVAKNKAEKIAFGSRVYKQNCMACHQEQGQGIEGAFPPLAKADYLKSKTKAIEAVVGGLSGKLIVNGKEYNGVMPAWELSDEDIANVLTYVYASWGNSGAVVTTDEVKSVRKSLPNRK
jgi:nitrite reductase (NO-forming)